jgi:ribonuclease HI
MDKEELLKDILNDPSKYYNKQELKLLGIKLKRQTNKGTMGKFIKKKVEYDKDRLFVFTDGSCVNNGKKTAYGGYGIFFGKNDLRNVSKRFDSKEKVSNNKAELTAILECLKLLTPAMKYYIVTDSDYSINCVTKWYKGWELNGWKTSKKQPVKNVELIKGIIECLKSLNIKFLHVESHKDMPEDRRSMEYKLWYGNYMADYLATQ